MSNPLFAAYRVIPDAEHVDLDNLQPGTVESVYIGRMRYQGGEVKTIAFIGPQTDDEDLLYYVARDGIRTAHKPTVWVHLQRIDTRGTTVLVGDSNRYPVQFAARHADAPVA